MVLLRPLFPYSWSFPSWDLRRVLNCILIPLIELEDSSNVEVDEGFISLASLFGISAYLSFGCVLSCFSHVWLYATLWIVACQAPLSMGFSRQQYCSRLPFPSPGDLLNPWSKLASLISPALASGFFTTSATWEVLSFGYISQKMFMRNCLLLGPGDSDGKESACSAGHPGLIPGLGRSPGDGNGNPLQYFCLDNSMNGRAYSPLGRKRVGHSWATNTPPRAWIFYNRTFEQNLSTAFEQRQLISITVNLSRLTTGSAVEVDTHQIPWCAGVPVLSWRAGSIIFRGCVIPNNEEFLWKLPPVEDSFLKFKSGHPRVGLMLSSPAL